MLLFISFRPVLLVKLGAVYIDLINSTNRLIHKISRFFIYIHRNNFLFREITKTGFFSFLYLAFLFFSLKLWFTSLCPPHLIPVIFLAYTYFFIQYVYTSCMYFLEMSLEFAFFFQLHPACILSALKSTSSIFQK